MKKIWNILFILCLMLSLTPSILSANAYCSLRDPIAAIHNLFPEATDHQSIVKIVNKDARNAVSDQLPFTLHFNELGKHTLYVALNKNTPTGLIHARSELSDWGIIEIAWALNLDLSIHNFYIQRCRIPACSDSNLKFLKDYLKGKSFKQVLKALSPNGEKLYIDIPSKSNDIESLSRSIIQSALKTITVTNIVWKEELENLNRHASVKKYFPSQQEIEIASQDPISMSQSEIYKTLGYDPTFINFNSLRSFQVKEKNRNTLGYIVEAEWNVDHHSGEFTWLFLKNGKVLAVKPKTTWPNSDIQKSFDSVVGQMIAAPADCSSFAELAASEIFFMSGANR